MVFCERTPTVIKSKYTDIDANYINKTALTVPVPRPVYVNNGQKRKRLMATLYFLAMFTTIKYGKQHLVRIFVIIIIFCNIRYRKS